MANIDLTGKTSIAFDLRASRTGSNLKFGLHNTTNTVFQDLGESSNGNHMGDHSDAEYRHASKIVLANSTTITAYAYLLAASQGSPTGDHTVRIETDSSGPSGTLAHANLAKIITPTASAWNTATFNSSATLAAGTYWVVLLCDNQSTNVSWILQDDSISPHTGFGLAQSNNSGSTWTVLSSAYGTLTQKLFKAPVTSELTPNVVEADTWQKCTWDLSGVADADKDAIDQFIVTVVNADAANTFYIDNFAAGLVLSLEETITISDTYSNAFTLYPLAETITLSENSDINLFTKVLSETIDISEDRAFTSEWYRTLEDTISPSDEVLNDFALDLTEDITISENTNIVEFNKLLIEDITISENANIVEFNKLLTEEITVSDDYHDDYWFDATEDITISEECGHQINWHLTLSEDITVSEDILNVKTKYLDFNETITLSDTYARTYNWALPLSETATLDDYPYKAFAYNTLTDSITISDTMTKLRSALIELSESITVTDTYSREVAWFLGLAETLSMSELMFFTGVRANTYFETITVDEQVNFDFNKLLSETIDITDNPVKDYYRLAFSETITMTDRESGWLRKSCRPFSWTNVASTTGTWTDVPTPSGVWLNAGT